MSPLASSRKLCILPPFLHDSYLHFQPSVNKFDHLRERGPKEADSGEEGEEERPAPKTAAVNLHVAAVATLFALSTACFLELVLVTGCATDQIFC